MKLAIIQPYFFPYLGYFQLVGAVDKVIFFDDVNYIKSGWINRNRILINNEVNYFTIPVLKASSNKFIREIEFELIPNEKERLLNKIRLAYSRAPFFDKVIKVLECVLSYEVNHISELAIASIKECCSYLNIKMEYSTSSETHSGNRGLFKTDRLVDICTSEGANTYINPKGGKSLYSSIPFLDKGIKLKFLNPHIPEYNQFEKHYIPDLSILDVMMFCSIADIQLMLKEYTLDD